jgi:hypothetical protein
MAQRSTPQTLAWYDSHRTKAKIGFDPDGMCLKVCRSARNIGSYYPSAIAAAHGTPAGARVKMAKLKPGMVAYFDDPNDSNPSGHIVTVRAVAPIIRSLNDIIVETNSVKSDQLVKVRGDYFQKQWGDSFQFGATVLNKVNLLLPQPPAPQPQAPPKKKMPKYRALLQEMKDMEAWHRKAGNKRIADAMLRDIAEVEETIKKFG